jgi:hypothetical protein
VLRTSLHFISSAQTGFLTASALTRRRRVGLGWARGNFTPSLEAQTNSSSLTVREVHRVPDSFCLQEMTAFVAGNDFESSPDRETNSRG